MVIYDFKVEGMKDAVGIDRFHPIFSWKLRSEQSNVLQQKYSIIVQQGELVVWSRKNIKSSETINIRYAGEHLQPHTVYQVYLSVTDNYGNTAEDKLVFETGKLDEPFSARFIAPVSKDWHMLLLSVCMSSILMGKRRVICILLPFGRITAIHSNIKRMM